MTFQEMETVFAKAPKKVFIDFRADWCGACLRMDKHAFQNPEIIRLLNEDYYAVKMNAETKDTITFGGKTFINPSSVSGRRSYHELATLLGSDDDGQFALPALVIFDEEFQRIARYDRYINSKRMMGVLDSFRRE